MIYFDLFRLFGLHPSSPSIAAPGPVAAEDVGADALDDANPCPRRDPNAMGVQSPEEILKLVAKWDISPTNSKSGISN